MFYLSFHTHITVLIGICITFIFEVVVPTFLNQDLLIERQLEPFISKVRLYLNFITLWYVGKVDCNASIPLLNKPSLVTKVKTFQFPPYTSSLYFLIKGQGGRMAMNYGISY
jgi:hypothetical protein